MSSNIKKGVNFSESIPQNLGLFLTLFLSLFPAFLWFFTQPVGGKFADFSISLTSLGQISGLIGMAMMSVVIIISSRPIFLDKAFFGLDNLYKFHRYFGVASFLLLMLHPVLLAVSYMPFSKIEAALFLLPGSDLSRNLGITALLTMMVFIAVSVLSRIKYQILKFIHSLLGATFVFSVLHTVFVKSDILRNFFIHWYMFLLMGLAVFAYSYKTLLGKFLVKKYSYIVKEVNLLPGKTTEIVMAPQGQPMKYFSGQFIFINFSGEFISKEQHPFSICSNPSEPNLKILVKQLGDYTSKISSLPLGIKAEIEGPFGKFSYSASKNKNQIWIAGGSGIAPFFSMFRNLKEDKGDYKVDLYYCVNSKEEIINENEFLETMALNPNFKFIPFCQDEKGFISAEKVKKISQTIAGKDIFICGPAQMIYSLKKQFVGAGIPRRQIHFEEFKLL